MLAIVIPYYKRTYFDKTLQSLAQQTDKRFKVYIGDDASPEDCSDLIKKYEGCFSYTYHRFETNLGGTSLTQQWERCVALTGNEEWLMILGDDDWLSENVVERFITNYEKFNNKSNIVRFATIVKNSEDNRFSEEYRHPEWETGIEAISRKFQGISRGSLSELIFYKEEYLKFKFTDYSSAFYSDDKIILDLSTNKNIYTINETVVYVRISNESLSGQTEKNNTKLVLARFQFYQYLLLNNFDLFNLSIKKDIIEKLFNHIIDGKENQKKLLFKLFFKTLMLWDFSFLFKLSKKYLKKYIKS